MNLSGGSKFSLALQSHPDTILLRIDDRNEVYQLTYEKNLQDSRPVYVPPSSGGVEAGYASIFQPPTTPDHSMFRGRMDDPDVDHSASKLFSRSETSYRVQLSLLSPHLVPNTFAVAVATVQQVVSMLDYIHQLVKDGKSTSINAALKRLNKDRKTVDRFRHIYYMSVTDTEALDEVWQSLYFLSSMSLFHFDIYQSRCVIRWRRFGGENGVLEAFPVSTRSAKAG